MHRSCTATSVRTVYPVCGDLIVVLDRNRSTASINSMHEKEVLCVNAKDKVGYLAEFT